MGGVRVGIWCRCWSVGMLMRVLVYVDDAGVGVGGVIDIAGGNSPFGQQSLTLWIRRNNRCEITNRD